MSAPISSPPVESSASEPSDETLRRLARMLDFAAPGRFTLAFAKCNLPVQRRTLVERLKVLIEPLNVAPIEIELSGPAERLLPILQERLAGSYLLSAPPRERTPVPEMESFLAVREGQPKPALFVYGLEHSLPSSDPHPPILTP